uniref:MYND-type domain-containing protein n=1 Tax=Ciona savignyi TaxID=51511 RepID=H2YZW4_CIOSA
MDIQEDDHLSKKKDSIAAGLADKGIIKVKKINKDGGKEAKSSKPKSILLNKDAERRTSDPSTTPLRTSGHTGGNMKRKLAEDSPSSLPNVKVRKLDSGSKVHPAKEKKKIMSDSSKIAGKSEKDSDNIRIKKSDLTKIRKDVIPGSGGTTKKAINVEVVAKKKLVLTSDAMKPKADDGKEKSSLKSTAKILSQKVMNRKLEPSKKTAEKKISESEKSLFGEITPKKLSSFTIPKHKPVASAKSTSDTIVSKPSVSMVAPVQSNQRTSYQPTNHSNHISNTGNVPMQKIQKYNDKVMQGVQQVLVEMYEDMMSVFESNQGKKGTEQPDGTAGQQVAQLRLELERLKWMHQQEIAELQHNHDLTVAEIRQSLENEKRHLLENLKKKHDAEKISAVEETKRKQWCANCGKEAIFYCCWNTSYCDYPCQQRHWPKHMSTCSQASDTAAAAAQAETKTPTSPETKKQTEETKPEPPKEEDTMQVDDHDDDDDENSDNDMVIDENIDEPTPKKPDIPSPDS